MKKFIFFSAVALLALVILGCDDNTETSKKEYSVSEYDISIEDCETDKPIYETLYNEPATIKYHNKHEIFVIILNNPKKNHPLFPCGNSLPKEYRKEGLKVKVSGIYRNCAPDITDPNIKIAPFFKLNITSIKLNTK